MELIVSLSALPPSLYRKYRKGWKPNPTLLGLFEKLSGKKGHKAMRIYVDAKSSHVIKNIAQNVKPPIQIVDALADRDVQIVDYVAGTGRDKHDRIIKIGKVLAKDANLKKMFDSDPNRKSVVNATRSSQLVCISMHPYDIAGMSTDRGWTSCMNLNGGLNKKYIKQDVAGGTLIAYLIDEKDRNINRPVARCLAKPFFEQKKKAKASEKFIGSETVNALYVVEYAYPDPHMPFIHIVQDWLDANINPFLAVTERSGEYRMHSKLYVDHKGSVLDYDLEELIKKGDIESYVQRVSNSKFYETVDKVLPKVSLYPEIAAMLASRGWGTPGFYKRCLDIIQRSGKELEAKAFLKTVYANDRKLFLEIWEYLSGAPDLISLFLDTLPQQERVDFLRENIHVIELYSSVPASGIFPKAISSIWSVVKHFPNAERALWQYISRINVHGVDPVHLEDEMGPEDSEDFTRNVLIPSLAAYEHQDPVCAVATRSSLEKNKDIVPLQYYDAMQLMFDGFKCVSLEEGTSRNPLNPDNVFYYVNILSAKISKTYRKIKPDQLSKILRSVDAVESVHDAIYSLYSDVRKLDASGFAYMVKSDQTTQQILRDIVNKAVATSLENLYPSILEAADAGKAKKK